MEKYYIPAAVPLPSLPKARRHKRDTYEEHLEALAAAKGGGNDGGWRAELRDYLRHRPAGVHKHMDIMKWWAVSNSLFLFSFLIIEYISNRRMLVYTLLLHGLPSIFSPSLHRLFLASDFSRRPN